MDVWASKREGISLNADCKCINITNLSCFVIIPKETRQFAEFLHFDGFSFKITEDNVICNTYRKTIHPSCTCRIQFALDGIAASLVEELCDGKVCVTCFVRKVINEKVGMRLFSSSKMTKAKLVCALAWRGNFAKGNKSVTDTKRRMPDRSGDLVSQSRTTKLSFKNSRFMGFV